MVLRRLSFYHGYRYSQPSEMNEGVTEDECKVVINVPYFPHCGLYQFPRSTTIAMIENHWKIDKRIQGCFRFTLKGDNGETLTADRTISSILRNGDTLITLIPEAILQLKLKFGNRKFGMQGLLSQPTAELLEDVVKVFPSLKSQIFRLTTEERALVDELSLLEQGVGSETVLTVEIGFDIELENEWCDDSLNVIAFPSESLSTVLDNDWLKDHRFTFENRPIGQHDLFRDFINDIPCNIPVTITYAHSYRITLFINGEFHERVVWPDTLVKELSETRLAFNNRILDMDSTMFEVNISHQALLHDVVEVDLIGRHKAYHVSVPRMGCLLDVARAIPLESCLQSPETISTDCVVRLPPRENLTVELEGVDVNWVIENGPFSFTQFVEELAKESGRNYRCLRKNVFQCCGCGRRIRAEEEEYQLIPAACCSVRSLQLTAIPATKKITVGISASTSLMSNTEEDPPGTTNTAVNESDEETSIHSVDDGPNQSPDVEEQSITRPLNEGDDRTIDVVLRNEGNGFGFKLSRENAENNELMRHYKIVEVAPGSPAENGGIVTGNYLKEVHCDVRKTQRDLAGDIIRNVGNTLHITILRTKGSEDSRRTQMSSESDSSVLQSSSNSSDGEATKKKTDKFSWFIK